MDVQKTQFSIYIGLNDKNTGVQKFDTEKYVSILLNICHNYRVAFSFHVTTGGYFHDDGRYTEENSLVLMLLDVSEDVVMEIAKDMCAFFNQESVMIMSSPCHVAFVRDALNIHS